MISNPDADYPDDVIVSTLTRDGMTPIEHYFALHGQIHEWKPRVGVIITAQFYDKQLENACFQYLLQIGFACSDYEQIKELAIRLNWPKWGTAVLTTSLPDHETLD